MIKENISSEISLGSTPRKVLIEGALMNAGDGLDGNAHGIFIAGADEYEIRGVDLRGQTTAAIQGHSAAASWIVKGVIGLATTAEGIATVLSGTNSIFVNHGLAGTPTRVFLSPLDDPDVRFWAPIANYGSSQFAIVQDANAGANTRYAWRAIV